MTTWRSLLIAILILSSQPANANGQPASILLAADVHEDYLDFVHGRDVLTIDDYSGPGSRRDVIEVVLFRQALDAGNWEGRVRFVAANSYQRIVKEIETGRSLASATSVWYADLALSPDHYHISVPVIENGQFEAGLYARPDNMKAMAARDLDAVKALRTVSNESWTADWNTLEALGLNELHSVVEWLPMVRMVDAGRVDFLLAPFQPTADFSLEVDGIRLLPIPGVKLGLQGSRHFGVSRRHPLGDRFFLALNTGLRALKATGRIERAYRESGFFNRRVADWTMLN